MVKKVETQPENFQSIHRQVLEFLQGNVAYGRPKFLTITVNFKKNSKSIENLWRANWGKSGKSYKDVSYFPQNTIRLNNHIISRIHMVNNNSI